MGAATSRASSSIHFTSPSSSTFFFLLVLYLSSFFSSAVFMLANHPFSHAKKGGEEKRITSYRGSRLVLRKMYGKGKGWQEEWPRKVFHLASQLNHQTREKTTQTHMHTRKEKEDRYGGNSSTKKKRGRKLPKNAFCVTSHIGRRIEFRNKL